MKQTTQESLQGFFDERIAACARRGEALFADERIDEAGFEKVRANVYDIFRTVLAAAKKTCGGDEAAERAFFLRKTEQIPSAWAAAYDNAKQHGDARRICVERIKLDTIREIRDEAVRLWGASI